MKIERIKNATRNMVFGMLLKIYQILMPFIMRTVMIYFMGVQYLGLNSLFTSILQVLNLAELGVGSAMIFSMYKPIVDDDNITICALLKLYRLYYRIIGAVIALAGIILTPFIPNLIKSDVPDNINVYILYLLNLTATVLSYWLLAYKNSIFQAYQRTDVTSKVMLCTQTIQYILQLIAIIIFNNYYLYVIVLLLTQTITNIVTAILADKMYPTLKPKGQLDKTAVKKINKRIRDLFTSKIGSVVVNSADTIVISAFLGLTVLAVYQNYFYILTAIIGVVSIIFNSCTAGIGNSLIVETKEKNFNDLNKFTFIIIWIAGVCSSCLLNMFQPFMKIWVGESLMLRYSAVICLVIYYFIYEINQLLNLYKDAGGIWHKDRFRPLVTAIANIVLNLILVNFWGIYGVLLSTVLSMLIVGMPWLFQNLFTTLFEIDRMKEYIMKILVYSFVSFIGCIGSIVACHFVNLGSYATLILKMLISIIIPNILFCIVYRKTNEYNQTLNLVNKMTHGKISCFLKKIGME